MEQLVIFNSQLAVMKGQSGHHGTPEAWGEAAPSPAPAVPPSLQGEAESLREEIVALRALLAKQATKEENTSEVLSELRRELATIRAELTGTISSQVPEQEGSTDGLPTEQGTKKKRRGWLKKIAGKSKKRFSGVDSSGQQSGTLSVPSLSTPLDLRVDTGAGENAQEEKAQPLKEETEKKSPPGDP